MLADNFGDVIYFENQLKTSSFILLIFSGWL